MAYPSGWTTRSVVATYLNPDGSAAVGRVDFTPSGALLDNSTDDMVLVTPLSVYLSDGMLTVSLPCTDAADVTATDPDDADTVATEWWWQVSERIKGGRTYLRSLPTGDGSTVSLFDLTAPD